jgi:excisionase family DNA binding protein
MSKDTAPSKALPAVAPRALSPVQAARYIGCGKTKMWALIMSGRIPSKMLDGRRLILTSDLDAFLDGLPKAAVAS